MISFITSGPELFIFHILWQGHFNIPIYDLDLLLKINDSTV